MNNFKQTEIDLIPGDWQSKKIDKELKNIFQKLGY